MGESLADVSGLETCGRCRSGGGDRMSDFPQEEPDDDDELIEEEGRRPTHQDTNGDLWETNDEPAQGEGGQDSV
jgi:hypothetical protein